MSPCWVTAVLGPSPLQVDRSCSARCPLALSLQL